MNNTPKFENNTKKYMKNNNIKKTLPLFYIFIIISLLLVYNYRNVNLKKQHIEVTGLTTNNYSLVLNYGQSTVIKVKVEPEEANEKGIIWSSSNPELVNVDNNGKITILKNENEEVLITAKTVEKGYTVDVKVKVIKIESIVNTTGIKLINKLIEIKYGETIKINATVEPLNATNKNVLWENSNPKLIEIDNEGNIKVLKNEDGESIITARTVEGNYKDSLKVIVKKINNNPNNNPTNNNIKVTGINIDKESIVLKYNEQKRITATVTPSNATNKDIIWTSNNTNLVTVDNQGKINAKSGKIGIATITAKTSDGGYTKNIEVKVIPSGNHISFSGGNNYSEYKTNMLLQRNNAVMQSFAIHRDYIYISQQQGEDSYGAHFSKIKLSDITNETGQGQLFTNNVAVIKDTGHASNIDIEETNNIAYLWTSCSKDSDEIKYHCRIPLNSIEFGNRITQEQKYTVKISGSYLVSVDSDNRIITLMTGNRRNHIFTTYNLDDYIENKEKSKVISQIKIDNGNYDISRQGFEVNGNYIYSYEGNKNNNSIPEVYLSVYTLLGEKIVDRKKINYPNNDYYWEPEGIKIYNNRIYIGFGREDKETKKKTSYIYKLN